MGILAYWVQNRIKIVRANLWNYFFDHTFILKEVLCGQFVEPRDEGGAYVQLGEQGQVADPRRNTPCIELIRYVK